MNVVEQDYVKGKEKDAAVIKIRRTRAKKIILAHVRRPTNYNILIHKEPERFRLDTKSFKCLHLREDTNYGLSRRQQRGSAVGKQEWSEEKS